MVSPLSPPQLRMGCCTRRSLGRQEARRWDQSPPPWGAPGLPGPPGEAAVAGTATLRVSSSRVRVSVAWGSSPTAIPGGLLSRAGLTATQPSLTPRPPNPVFLDPRLCVSE